MKGIIFSCTFWEENFFFLPEGKLSFFCCFGASLIKRVISFLNYYLKLNLERHGCRLLAHLQAV